MNINIEDLPNATLSILKGKFVKTIQKIEGTFQEARNDKNHGTAWTMGEKLKRKLREFEKISMLT
jgi:hypothetical protein